MKKHLKSILTLLILSPLLAEVVSGNTPITVFVQPISFLLLITFGYGFPVLIIREISIRQKLGMLGLFSLGIMYGLYNEALIARTVFVPFLAPISTFATYGIIGGTRIPWALMITFWHALFSVIYPIIFVYFTFPASATETWIGKKTTWFLGILCVLFGTINFFSKTPSVSAGTLGEFLFIILSCLALWGFSRWISRTPQLSSEIILQSNLTHPAKSSRKNVWLGFGLFILLFLIPLFMAQSGVAALLFILYFIIVTTILIRKISHITSISVGQLTLVGLGGYFIFSLFTLVISAAGMRLVILLSSLVFVIIFGFKILTFSKN